jgi:hypothetical protein
MTAEDLDWMAAPLPEFGPSVAMEDEFPFATVTISPLTAAGDYEMVARDDVSGQIVAADTFYTLASAVDAALRLRTHRVTFAH